MFKKLFRSKNENTLSNAEVEKLMTTTDGKKLGESEEMLLYGGFQDLNNYYFLETLFLSVESIKSKRGATITFKSEQGEFVLKASMLEFDSEYVKQLERHVTQISFDIEKDQIKKIQSGAYQSIELKVKNKVFTLLNG
ncbi:MAG: hypothetical protein CMC75_04135 [Flavobacteriaceae bacterium]|mgnify:FL=1|nr:hypothetical protein [Flavobacteriaceae bacterium]MAY52440.1 hypothetical protein [Flavobacteriaceae bacterium]|tara:strand:+ start:599 stop:1012 length:414 start_codon:yes stop_codon:yes gene_type:complete